ncbi:MAG: two-component sensor histidine kinase [Deltaproteobacteria bacterium]|nr:MAG: two-component sensor histidine kinase [Deltaproteobacteria bacterium]
MMSIIDALRPKFWNYQDVTAGSHQSLFSFRRKWWRTVILTTIVALAPLFVLSVVNYRMTRENIRTTAMVQTHQMISGIWRAVSFFLSERRSVLAFVLQDNSLPELLEKDRLSGILKNLQTGVGGFVDLSVVSADGALLSYAGPHPPGQRNFCKSPCFNQVVERGFYIGDLAGEGLSGRHLVMAIRSHPSPEQYYIIRATVDIKPFEDLITSLDVSRKGDTFIINKAGFLQTHSRYYGPPSGRIPLDVPAFSTHPRVFSAKDKNGTRLIVGVAGIPNTSLMVMTVSNREEQMKGWRQLKIKFFFFLGISVAAILLMVLGMATYLVNRIHAADQKRIMELHKVEYANKMASLGRLSAGVGHEVNNPMAIINEKIGLIRDLLVQNPTDPFHEKMVGLADDIITSTRRVGNITRRLINFGRYEDIRPERLDLGKLIYDLVAFMQKEAEHLGIDVKIDVPENFPQIESDRNSLQQIFLNIINNAFAAMEDGGQLDITVTPPANGRFSITLTDTGQGLAEEDLKRVFEPFFSAASKTGGTGLGLSVTYGLVNRIGGHIRVESAKNQGARFIIDLPVHMETKEGKGDGADSRGDG